MYFICLGIFYTDLFDIGSYIFQFIMFIMTYEYYYSPDVLYLSIP